MHILTKVGNQDNVVTYEHICDTLQDRDNIERRYITLGSTCLVLSGENDTIEVYMADSNKEWHDIAVSGGGGGGSGSGGLQLYVCTASEVQNGKPSVEIPIEDTLYLVPGGTEGNLYTEYMYVNNNWELFGGASVDLTNYASKQWVQDQHYLTSYTETDPTVPAWAKSAQKPTYTANEVGAATELSQLTDVEFTTYPEEGQTLMYLPVFDENGEIITDKWMNANPLSVIYGYMADYENPVLGVEFLGATEPITNPYVILDILLGMNSKPYIWHEDDDLYVAIKQIDRNSGRIICCNGDIFEISEESDAFELVSSQENTPQNVKLAYTYVSEHETNLLALVENSSGDIVSIDANDIQNYLESSNGKMFVTTYSGSNITYAIRELEYLRGFPRITLINGDMFTSSSYIDDIPVYTIAGNEE